MEPSDAELIARVLASDDRPAFSDLVRRHQSAVRGWLRKLTGGDAALADDLAQETFLRAYRALPSYRGGAQFSTWLGRVAANAFLSDARKKTQVPVLNPEELSQASSAEVEVLRRELWQAMARLRPQERAALAVTYGRDLTHEEAAEILHWPLGTLKTHIARGKQKLRLLLGAPIHVSG